MSSYVCQACGVAQRAKFLQCPSPSCRQWDRCVPAPRPVSISEAIGDPGAGDEIEDRGPDPISIADAQVEHVGRILSRITPLDLVLGGGLAEGSVVHLSGSPGVGKAQPLDAQILTPRGFVAMGSLQPGSEVIGGDGSICLVVAIHDRGMLPIVRVTMNDGSSTECSEDHLWTIRQRHRPRWIVRSTSEIRSSLWAEIGKPGTKTPKNRAAYRAPVVRPVAFHAVSSRLPIDPYVLGALLGDGCLMSASITMHKPEDDVLTKVADRLPSDDLAVRYLGGAAIRITRRIRRGGKCSETMAAIRQLGLARCDSFAKFIPRSYLFASCDDRLELLRGICDTDGSVHNWRIDLSLSSPGLARDVVFLARSLGATTKTRIRQTTYTHRGEKKPGARSYRTSIFFPDGTIPVSSAKHLRRWRHDAHPYHRTIASIDPAGEKPCRCITIDGANGLYVTDDFIVTHNSTLAIQAADGLAAAAGSILYASSEETVGQVKDRADRLAVVRRDRVFLVYEARVEAILARCPAGGAYAALIVDSAQTATTDGGAPGTLKTVVEVARRLVSHAKRTGIPVILVGHVTKDGEAAGPQTLMHLVDVVLSIEGDPKRPDRTLSAAKNRFGSTAVQGILHMTEAGLVVPPDLG